MKNIMIYIEDASNSIKGGTERSSHILLHHLNHMGYNAQLLCLRSDRTDGSSIPHIFLPKSRTLFDATNKAFIEKICHNNRIHVIINMSANTEASYFFSSEHLNITTKIISVINFSIFEGLNYYKELMRFDFSNISKSIKSIIKLSLTPVLKQIAIARKKNKLKAIINNSWKVVVLSESYIEDIKKLLKLKTNENILAIPVMTTNNIQSYIVAKKENIVLYVGRLSYADKRVDRLLHIWGKIQQENPNWELHILGDGPEKFNLTRLTNQLSLKRVIFHGHQDPTPHYLKAKILCLTSTHEGIPMVILEAIENGCYPIAFDSFSAAKEIFTTSCCGKLIKPFDLKEYAKALSDAMNGHTQKSSCSRLSKYHPDHVMPLWVKCIEE